MNEALPKTRNRLIRIWRKLTDKGKQAWAAFKTMRGWSWRVLRTPTNRLSYRVERWIRDWNRTNPARYKRAYPSLTLLLSWGTEHPVRFGLLPFALVCGVAVLQHLELIVLPGLEIPGITMKFAEHVRPLALWERVGVRERSGAR